MRPLARLKGDGAPQTDKKSTAKVAATRKRRGEEDALAKAYFEKFGIIGSINLSPANLRAMEDALRDGVDHVDLLRQREESER